MKRSTETLSLVLIGSVLAMAGGRSTDEDDEQSRGVTHGDGVAYLGGRSLVGGRPVSEATPSLSARGGFGGSAMSVAG